MEELYLMNPHWQEGFFYPYEKERKIVQQLKRFMKEPIIKVLSGPRRVGKTVMLKQLINHLIKEGVPRKQILYYSFENRERIWKVVEAFLEFRGESLGEKNLYLLLDEVQYAPNWAPDIKRLYDMWEHKLNFALSGSTSLEIERGRVLLAGRFYSIEIGALSFEEYLSFTGRIKHETEFKLYLRRQLPYLALHPEVDPYHYIKEVIRKSIYEDSRLLNIQEPDLLESIFKAIVSLPGQIIRIEDISRDFQISRATARKYLLSLEQLKLIRKVYNFRGSRRKIEVKAKKFYPYYTTLSFYGSQPDLGHLYESYVAETLKPDFFWRKGNQEIDFYFPEEKTAIEVKAGKRIRKRELSTLCNPPIPVERRMLITSPDGVVELPCEVEQIPILEVEHLNNFGEKI